MVLKSQGITMESGIRNHMVIDSSGRLQSVNVRPLSPVRCKRRMDVMEIDDFPTIKLQEVSKLPPKEASVERFFDREATEAGAGIFIFFYWL